MSKSFHVICGVALLAGVVAAQDSEAQQSTSSPPTAQSADRATSPTPATTHSASREDSHLRDFRNKLIWKAPLAKTVLSAGFNEVRNSPHEWGRGWEGFGKRAGSSFAQRAIKATVELGVSTWTHEDLHYHRLGEGGFFHRVGHAVISAYWVPRDNGSDGNTIAFGRLTGALAAGQLARTWMPSRVATFGAGMQSFGYSVGLDMGFNVLREFWPKKH